MTKVEERKEILDEELGLFADTQELFEYLIYKSKEDKGLEEEFKTEENLVKGCVSSLWLLKDYDGQKCYFRSDADSLITKAIAGLVTQMYDGLTPEEVLSFDASYLDKFGISLHLSPNRRNGLSQICKKIFEYAKDKK